MVRYLLWTNRQQLFQHVFIVSFIKATVLFELVKGDFKRTVSVNCLLKGECPRPLSNRTVICIPVVIKTIHTIKNENITI